MKLSRQQLRRMILREMKNNLLNEQQQMTDLVKRFIRKGDGILQQQFSLPAKLHLYPEGDPGSISASVVKEEYDAPHLERSPTGMILEKNELKLANYKYANQVANNLKNLNPTGINVDIVGNDEEGYRILLTLKLARFGASRLYIPKP